MNKIYNFGKTIKANKAQSLVLNNIIETLSNLDTLNIIEGIHIAKYSLDSQWNLLNRIDIYIEFNPEKEIPENIKDYIFDIAEERRTAVEGSISPYLMVEYTGPDFPKCVCIWEKGDSK